MFLKVVLFAFLCLVYTMAENLRTCPFCGKTFKQLGQHLYRCPDCHNRDYQQYLKTSKTVDVCPGCHRSFKRLDLHLKSNKLCYLYSTDKTNSISQPQQTQHSGLMENAQSLPPSSPVHPTATFSPKVSLHLPTKKDASAWFEADAFMKSVVTPSILSLTSVDDMNATLNNLIYEYFSSMHGTIQPSKKKHAHHHKSHLQSSLANVRREKSQLKKKFRAASKDATYPKEDLIELSKSFHSLVKRHSMLRKKLLRQNRMNAANHAINECSRNFWKFADKLLSDNDKSNVQPSFNQDQAYRFFSSTYKSSSSEVFHQPSWMPDTPAPSTLFYHGSITHEELAFTLKKCRCGSAPNPLDGISYTILKQCPSLRPALLHLYNTCIMQSQVPSQWKAAVIKLIPKPAAQSCPSNPKNFRPIALTSCIG